MDLKHFQFTVDADGVALVLMDVSGQAMNTISTKVSADLDEIVSRIEKDDAIKAVVIGSAKKGSFIAGADIDMISEVKSASEAADLSKSGQEGMTRLEKLSRELGKPVVAAIDGPAMGGGLELALACSMRLISDSPKTVLALPEVKLGLLPGAGGTQRLPALIGIVDALDIMLTGKNIRAKKALKLGLADEVVPADVLLEVAKKRALGQSRQKRAKPAVDRLKEFALEDNPVGRMVLFKQARETVRGKTRGKYPATERIIDAVKTGASSGREAGYAAEAQYFGELAVSAESKAMVSIFFGTQELKKDSGVSAKSVKSRPVKRVGVLGGGLMGAGIASISVMKADTPVRIKEVDDQGLGRGYDYVRKLIDKDVKRKIKSKHDALRLGNMVTGCTDLSGFKGVDLVIEAVFEDLELKRQLLRDVEAATRPESIFASNTSSLPIGDIAEASRHPETVIGMHYFSPVEKMPLLEIITTDKTADWVTATCVEYGKAQGKIVIVVQDGTGFYTSRILAPYMNEAAWAISEGVRVEELDQALVNWGFPVGPMTLLDEVGIDVGAKVAGIMEKAFGERVKAPEAMDRLGADNRLGRKNGRGFYRYEQGRKGGVDESVYGVLGVQPSKAVCSAVELQERLTLQMVNEAALCLEEGILRSPRDGDIGAIFGLGFPPYTGGPFTYCDTVGVDTIVSKLKAHADRFGSRFEPAQILVDHANANKRFR
ncbi:MAG: fatty acid oxidation complex subunit alpha FadJ [Myxococcota bacterium]|nr:fatty acid oxidation complex subunit alpha FadJ [Myxococcota bacterium]